MIELRSFWRAADKIGFWTGSILLIVQGFNAVGYCWRFPVADELSNFGPATATLSRDFSWAYLFSFQNEHCIFLTRLFTWVMYRFVDGNPVIHTICNYCIFLAACFLLRHLLRQLQVQGADLLFCTAALPIPIDVHNWAFQTHFYATFLVFLGAMWALSRKDARAHLAGPLAVLGCISFSAGIAFAGAVGAVASCFALWYPARRKTYLGVVGASIAGIGIYAHFFPGHLPGHPPLAFPWAKPFWAFSALHLGASLGLSGQAARQVGYVLITVGLASLVLLAQRAWRQRSVAELTVVGIALGILGSLALTALGRAGEAGDSVAVSVRYTTYTLFFAMIIWTTNLALFRQRQRLLLSAGLLILAIVAPHFPSKRHYRRAYEENLQAQRCAWDYYLGHNQGDCKYVLPWRSAALLDSAWRSDVFAVKEFKQLHADRAWRYSAE